MDLPKVTDFSAQISIVTCHAGFKRSRNSLAISSSSDVIIGGGFSLLHRSRETFAKTRPTNSHIFRNLSSISYKEFHLVLTSWINFRHSDSGFLDSFIRRAFNSSEALSLLLKNPSIRFIYHFRIVITSGPTMIRR